MAEYNLGTARGKIELDASQVSRSTENAQRDVENFKKELSGSDSVFNSVVSGLDGLGAKITSVFTTGVLAVGGLVTALGGLALWGGLKRVLDTEDARVQMERMGLSIKEVDGLLASVDETFQGTPFSNPDGFNISSQLFASGVELNKIPPILGDIADLAAHGNVPIDQMGSLFVRVASQGKVTGQEINRLTDMNIPLTQLADAMGLSVAELREMTSEGKLTADQFFEGIAAVEMFEGAAKAMGTTTRGAFANVRTALAVLGDKFLSPIFGQNGYAVQAMQALREALRGLFPAAAEAGEAFSKWLIPAIESAVEWLQNDFVPAIQRVIGVVQEVIGWYKQNEDTIKSLLAAMAPAAGIIGAVATATHLLRTAWMLLQAATPIGLLFLLVSALTYAWQNSEKFREVVTNAFEAVRGVVENVLGLFSSGQGSGIFDTLIGAAQTFAGFIRDVLGAAVTWFRDLWDTLAPRFEAIGESFRNIVEILTPVAQWLGEVLPVAFQKLWAIAGPILGFLVETLGGALMMAIDGVVQVFQGAVGIIEGILMVFKGLFTGNWSELWEGVKTIFVNIWNTLVGLVKTWLAGSFLKVFSGGLALIRNLWSGAWTGIQTFFVGIFNAIRNFLTAGMKGSQSTVSSVLTAIRNVFSSVWNGINSFLRGILNGIWNFIKTVFNGIRMTISTVLGAARSSVQTIWGSIRALFSTAVEAIKTLVVNGFNALKTGAINGITNLLSTVRGIPGQIKSALGDLGNLLRESGKAIIRGLIGGISSMAGNVKEAVTGVLNKARALLPFSPAKEGPFSGKGWTLFSGRSMINALAQGIEDQEKAAIRAALGVAKSVSGAFNDVSLASSVGSISNDLIGNSANSGRPTWQSSSIDNSRAMTFTGNIVLPNITDRSSAEDLLNSLTQAVRQGAR